MNKTLLGIIIGLSLSVGFYAFAFSTETKTFVDNGIQFLRGSFGAGWYNNVETFMDNETGVVCYVLSGGSYMGGISCVKVK